jgi:hypothetical protein
MLETSGARAEAVRRAVRILATEVIEVALADRARIRMGRRDHGHMETAEFLRRAMKDVLDRVDTAVDEQVRACVCDAAAEIEPGAASETWAASMTLHEVGHEAGRRGIVRVMEAAARAARDREDREATPPVDWSPAPAVPAEPDQVPF